MESLVEKLPNEPIILVHVRPHLTESSEVDEVAAACDRLIEGRGPYYRITDFSQFSMTFSGLVLGMATETQHIPGSLSDPRLRNIFVGTQEMVDLGAKSARQAQYGELEIMLFASLDQAIEYARLQLTIRG